MPVKDSSRNPPLPTEFWDILHRSVLELLNNGNNIVSRLDQVIQSTCKNQQYEYYVPPKVGQQQEYEAKLPHYIGFTTWLLAQIVRATTVDDLQGYHQQLLDWQVTILEVLAQRNQFMLSVVLSEYLAVVTDLVAARNGKESSFEFLWFQKANVDSQPSLDKFTLRNRTACGVLLSHLLKVLRSQTQMLAVCNPIGMSEYWTALLALLGDSDVHVWLAALDSVATNIKCDGFPSEPYKVYDLCETLATRLTRPGAVRGLSEAALHSTNAFFQAVLAHHKMADRNALARLYLGLVSQLEPKNPILCSGITSRNYCKLTVLLSKECHVSVDLKKKILPLLSNASHFTDILLIVESLVWDELEAYPSTQENTRMCEEISCLWKSVVETASKAVESLSKKYQDKDETTHLTKFMSSVTLAAANLSLRLQQTSISVIFFGNNFYQNWNKMLLAIDLNPVFVYLEVAKASKYLASLQDMATIDLKEANSLLAFLSVPWLNCPITAQLPQVDLTPYRDIADQEIFIDDAAVSVHSLEGVMVAWGGLSLDWRLAVLTQVRGADEVTLLRTACAMLTTLPPETRPRAASALVDPYFTPKNDTMLPRIAEMFPTVACALAGTTELARFSGGENKNKSDMLVRCKVCDGNNSEDTRLIEDNLAATTLEKYLQLRFSKDPSVRRHVAASLRRWSKHIPEPILRQHVEKWLRYIKDQSHEVRMAMAENAAHLVSADSTPNFIGFYRQVMLELIHSSLSPPDHHFQFSLMNTAYNVGSQPLENILHPTLELFVPLVCDPLSLQYLDAMVHLNRIAIARGKTPRDLFFRFQDELFKYVAMLLIMNCQEDNGNATTMLLQLARAFSFTDTKEFWDLSGSKHLLKHLLPHIIKNPTTKDLLTPIAAAAGSDVATVLKDSFPYVYTHVLLFEDKAVQDKVFQLIEQFTELSRQSLICCYFKVVICELLLYYHMEKTKVTEALRTLRDCDFGSGSTSDLTLTGNNKPVSPNTDITQFLQPRILAVLAYLDSILVTQSSCESTKRHALLTLPELIKLMGTQHITPVRFKVLATLRYALNLYDNYFPQLICFAWRAFVQNVSSLGPLLSTIFVSLLPLLDQYPVEISSVFRILVVDNLEAVRDHLAELYFLPDTPPTHHIYCLVQQELEKLRKLPVKEQLAVTLRLATNENTDVRLRGLHKLRADLAGHRDGLAPLLSAHDSIDPFILKLLEALLAGCQDPDGEVRLASAQCLGELGALDPGRLPNKFRIEVEEKEMFVINSEAFVLRALNEFVRAFQAASRHTTTMDVFAFGIQELLKIYKVPETGVWDQLSDATKEIISPFRESRYQLTDPTDCQPHVPHPIFGTNFGSSLKLWAWNWVSRLIPSVTDEFVRKVFSVCLLGLKKDLQSLLFFLPHIVLHAVLGATRTQSRRIAEEMSAVLFHRGDDQPTPDTPRSLPASGSLQNPQVAQDETHTQALCAKTVYQLLDFLYNWLRQTKYQLDPSQDPSLVQQYNTLKEFLSTFSKKDIADGSFSCKEYTRALLFLEEFMDDNPNLVQTYLPYLGKIYYHLHDPDSFKGAIAIREEEPTAQEMILYHKLTGKLQDAAACYERLVQLQESVASEDEDCYKGMVQCYLGMDQPSTALQLTQGFLSSVDRSQCGDMVDEQAEAMLALSMFPQLERLLDSGATATAAADGWGTALGRALLHLAHGSEAEMVAGLDRIRRALVRNLAGASLTKSATGYRHGYDVVVKLHILSELEKVGQMVFKMQGRPLQEIESMFKQVVQKELEERLRVVQPSYRVLQPVLCVRRVVLSLARDISPSGQALFTSEIGNSWLKSIEIARKSGHFQQAYTNILTVEPYKPKGLFVEKARLLWAKSEPEAALTTLRRGVERNFPNMEPLAGRQSSGGSGTVSDMDDRRLCAEAYLLIAQYNDESANIDMDTNIKNYKKAVSVCPAWEKSCVCLAQCYYKYLRSTQLPALQLECQIHLINMFGKSLQYGCEYIYQSMPRMLSIWLDFGTQLAQDSRAAAAVEGLDERKKAMDKMTGLIEAFSKRLPTYMFMTAFSQIISRICHPQKGCYNILKAIIIKIIIAYPQQALWMFLSVYKSPYTVQVKRCEEVLKSSDITRRAELNRTIIDFQELFDRLIELGNKKIDGKTTRKVNIRTFLRSLYSLVSNPGFSRVVIPLQRFRTISLPRTMAAAHNPFPEDLVYISGIKEEVIILTSLQKPKRISFIGTDGKEYSLLCKPNDDLRLDSRMMEFNSIVNMYLQRDPEARERGLYIRTYSAVPLSDTSGIIEWVPNLIGLRPLLLDTYKKLGIYVNPSEMKEFMRVFTSKSTPVATKRAELVEKLLPRHPPVLREWYLREFSHPTAWYLARTAYVRTLAVMSIVGFMLGLGDRHGENILIDTTCGDAFHVDFNCLFNKGERFEVPEKVPFRLTHNMVHAMGPTGVEGLFRHSCEITTRVMRQQMDQLMSVVRPFCYDPLVSWNTNARGSRDDNAEMTNEKAMEDIQNIEMRLQGIVKTRSGSHSAALSVEGQVRILIAEATDVNNLCQMFPGWGPWL